MEASDQAFANAQLRDEELARERLVLDRRLERLTVELGRRDREAREHGTVLRRCRWEAVQEFRLSHFETDLLIHERSSWYAAGFQLCVGMLKEVYPDLDLSELSRRKPAESDLPEPPSSYYVEELDAVQAVGAEDVPRSSSTLAIEAAVHPWSELSTSEEDSSSGEEMEEGGDHRMGKAHRRRALGARTARRHWTRCRGSCPLTRRTRRWVCRAGAVDLLTLGRITG